MPDVVGSGSRAALDTLESYGIEVTPIEVLNADVSLNDNSVVAQTPAVGEPFATVAQIVIGRRPVVIFLEELELVERGAASNFWGFGQAQVNGEVYTQSLPVDPSSSQSAFLEFDLARGFERLVTRIGLRDDVSSTAVFKVEIFADGLKLADQDVGLGQTFDLDLDVSNALRLRLQVTEISTPTTSGDAIFTEIRLLGLPGKVPTPADG